MTGINSQREVLASCPVRGGTSILALNSANNRLIAAGQQNFQLFAIDSADNGEQFREVHDFRNAPRQPFLSRYAFQPKDVAWNFNDEHSFATASGTSGYVYVWDAAKLEVANQLNIHNSIINRIQFHPRHKNILLTASQDGYSKLLDIRTENAKAAISFRHSSKEGFRDVDINLANTNKFASVINDQHCVPIWDIRNPSQPNFSVFTRDKVLCISWNPQKHYWLATGGVGGHDRTIRVWDAKMNNSRQDPLFTVYTFGQVAKLGWRPTCHYHIACFTRTADQRIHVWDVRRPYLPQASFCHHRNDIEDFLWRPHSDNLISVGRDERLILSHMSKAVQSERFVSLFSLNVTSKGYVHVSMPSIDNDYVHSLYIERHIPLSSVNLRRLYSQETISKFVKWDKTIKGESILSMCSSALYDDSVQAFHQFARRWTFGDGNKSLTSLAHICESNGMVAEDLNRPDLKATWEVIKMLFIHNERRQNYPTYSTKSSRSVVTNHSNNDKQNMQRYNNQYPIGGKMTQNGKQEESSRHNARKRNSVNSRMETIDDDETYIVRDVLTDDVIFVTPEDILNNGNGNHLPYDSSMDFSSRRDSSSNSLFSNNAFALTIANGAHNGRSLDRIIHRMSDAIAIDDDDSDDDYDQNREDGMEQDNGYDNASIYAQMFKHSNIPNCSETFFTIDESYYPSLHQRSLNFDEIIRQTILYYIENNEIQVAIHILLALYPQFNERKRVELFSGIHLQWIWMYIELLQKMRLFIKAKQVTKHCIENEGIPLNYNTAEFDGAIMFATQLPTSKRVSALISSAMPFVQKSSPALFKEPICSICRLPCRGLFSFCGVCSHGGHIDHIQTWFRMRDECPFGCGHRCKYFDHYNRQSYAS